MLRLIDWVMKNVWQLVWLLENPVVTEKRGKISKCFLCD